MLTDIVGYTAMTQKNESLSLQLLQAHNELLRNTIPRHHGREIKTIGDAFLVEFDSALDAFLCAVEIQETLHKYNETIPSKDMQIQIRIGLNFGDVVHQENDVFGDVVNICSRIQPLAEPGGICVSEQVYTKVKDKRLFEFQKLPSVELKNVIRPVVVYRVLLPWIATLPKSIPRAKAITSIKRRLAVLPLTIIGAETQDDYFADGLTEELITVLSNIKDLRVIARSSISRYKGTALSPLEIGKELSVGSILDGSIRKTGNKARVSVQVIDVETEEHVWARSYDYELTDVFTVQSDIARHVSKTLKVKLKASERARIEKKETDSADAYTLYLNGRFLLHKRNKQAVLEARNYFENAIVKDGNFARAYSGLADAYLLLGSYGYMEAKDAYSKAKEQVSKALDLDKDLPEAHSSLGFLLEAYYYDFAGARSEFEHAIALNPSDSQAHHWYAINLGISRDLDGAIDELEKAKEIDPLSPQIGTVLGGFYTYEGREEEALRTWENILKFNPDNVPVYLNRSLFYAKKSMKEQALSDMKKGLRLAWEATDLKCLLGYVYAVLGERDEALKILKEVKDRTLGEYVSPFYMAVLYSGLEDWDQCLAYVEKSIEDRSAEMESLLNDSMFEKIRLDPRLESMLSKLGISLSSWRKEILKESTIKV